MELEKMKTCSKCCKELPITNFYRNKNYKDGHDNMCKECKKEYNKSLIGVKTIEELKQYTNRQLIQELRNRGYCGKLKMVMEVEV